MKLKLLLLTGLSFYSNVRAHDNEVCIKVRSQRLGFLERICKLAPNVYHGRMLRNLLNCAAYCFPPCTPERVKKLENKPAAFILWKQRHESGIWNEGFGTTPYWPVIHHVDALVGLSPEQKKQQSFILIKRMIFFAVNRKR